MGSITWDQGWVFYVFLHVWFIYYFFIYKLKIDLFFLYFSRQIYIFYYLQFYYVNNTY